MLTRIQIRVICEMGLLTVYNGSKYGGYQPTETRFMKLSREHGARAYNGLEMLLYQGVEAFELWNDVKVPDELCRELYTLMKKEMGQE